MPDKSSSIYDRVAQVPGIADKAPGVETNAPYLQYTAEANQGHFFQPGPTTGREHFNFSIAFEVDWYVSLKKQQAQQVIELALLEFHHPTIPPGYDTERFVSCGFLAA